MKQAIFFTPGPSQLYPTVPEHIHTAIKNNICSTSHRSTEFQAIFKKTTETIKQLLNVPDDYHIYFISSATEAMEILTRNCIQKNSLHYVNGSFSQRAANIVQQLNKTTTLIQDPNGKGFKAKQTHSELANNEVVWFTLNETSTGIITPTEQIYNHRKKFPQQLLFVDIVSAVPHMQLNYSKIDAAFFSIQKGFGLPSGLGILIISPRTYHKAEELQTQQDIGCHHSVINLEKYAKKFQTPETPNILAIHLLAQVIKDIHQKNINEIRRKITQRAEMITNALEKNNLAQPSVEKSELRSETVMVFQLMNNGKHLYEYLYNNNIVIGRGYGKDKYTHIRISNFPAHTDIHFKQLLKAINLYAATQ